MTASHDEDPRPTGGTPDAGRKARQSSQAARHGNLTRHSEYLGKKIRDVDDFDWEHIDPQGIVGDTKYPQSTST